MSMQGYFVLVSGLQLKRERRISGPLVHPVIVSGHRMVLTLWLRLRFVFRQVEKVTAALQAQCTVLTGTRAL